MWRARAVSDRLRIAGRATDPTRRSGPTALERLVAAPQRPLLHQPSHRAGPAALLRPPRSRRPLLVIA